MLTLVLPTFLMPVWEELERRAYGPWDAIEEPWTFAKSTFFTDEEVCIMVQDISEECDDLFTIMKNEMVW